MVLHAAGGHMVYTTLDQAIQNAGIRTTQINWNRQLIGSTDKLAGTRIHVDLRRQRWTISRGIPVVFRQILFMVNTEQADAQTEI